MVGAKRRAAENEIKKELEKARREADKIVSGAREEAARITEQSRHDEQSRRRELKDLEQRLVTREEALDKKLDTLDKRTESLRKNEDEVEQLKDEIRAIRSRQQEKLEKVAKLSKEEATEKLMQMTERDIKHDLLGLIAKKQTEARDNAEEQAALIITTAMERMASEVTAERTITSVKLGKRRDERPYYRQRGAQHSGAATCHGRGHYGGRYAGATRCSPALIRCAERWLARRWKC